jgi:hypothetical protein
MKGFDHPWHDMPDELSAVLYHRAFHHIFIVPKLPGRSDFAPTSCRYNHYSGVGCRTDHKKRSLSSIARQVGLVKYGPVHYNGDGFQKVELPGGQAHPLDKGTQWLIPIGG